MGKIDPAWKGLDPCPLNTWLDEVPEEGTWIIPDFVPRESMVLVSGQQKRAHKTWFVNACALAIASGKPIGPLTALETGPVLFFQEEGPRSGTKNRMLGLCSTYNIDYKTLSNIHYYFWRRVKLDTPYWEWAIPEAVRRLGAKLVILDALTYMHIADENKVSEMGKVIDTLHDIRAAGATVMFLAHTEKSRGATREADIDDQVRGASNVANAYDLHLGFRRYKMEDKLIDLTVRARESEELLFKVAWDIVTSEPDPKTRVRQVLSAKLTMKVWDENAETESEADLMIARLSAGVPMTWKQITNIWGVSQANAKAYRETLLARGELLATGDKTFIRLVKGEK